MKSKALKLKYLSLQVFNKIEFWDINWASAPVCDTPEATKGEI